MSDVTVGDADRPTLDVTPADNTTTATLTVTKPDNTSSTITVTAGALTVVPNTAPVQYTQRWTAAVPVTYTLPGRWILHWTVTGTGLGAEDQVVSVAPAPVAGGPTWIPGRSRVAAYIPHRTLATSGTSIVGSADTYLMTFDDTTTPTGTVVDRLIADGADWVSALVNPMNPASQPAAALAAALWAAVAVERNFPNDDQSLQRASDMERRLDTLLTALIKSNDEANSDTGTPDPAVHPLPVWSFPPAPCDPPYGCRPYIW